MPDSMIAHDEQPIKVYFPCIHGLSNGQLVAINCFQSEELKSTIKVVTGVDEEIACRIIGASRFNESDSRAGVGVMALFSSPFFHGESYGLALAAADKLVRFNSAKQWTEIYATGAIPADGCGRVDAVNGFAEKLDLLLKLAKPDSLFLYPKNNLSPSFDIIQEKLTLLQGKGIECIAITASEDLQEKICATVVEPLVKSTRKKIIEWQASLPYSGWQAVFGLSLVGIVIILFYVVFSPTSGQLSPDPGQNGIEKKNQSEKENTESHQETKQREQLPTLQYKIDNKQVDDMGQKNFTPDQRTQQVIIESTRVDATSY